MLLSAWCFSLVLLSVVSGVGSEAGPVMLSSPAQRGYLGAGGAVVSGQQPLSTAVTSHCRLAGAYHAPSSLCVAVWRPRRAYCGSTLATVLCHFDIVILLGYSSLRVAVCIGFTVGTACLAAPPCVPISV